MANRAQIKALHPEYNFGDIAKAIGTKWRESSVDDKAKYTALSLQDKLQCQQAK
jgi:hypothetical protein